jgi:hypothetical protein
VEPVVATGGNQRQIRSPRNPPKQAKSVAVGCHRLPEKFHGAERAGATITEAEGSHVIMVSQPEAVAEVILTAAAAVGQQSGAAAG